MSQAEQTQTEKHGGGVGAALRMLDIFASVGVQWFDLTHTNLDGEKRGFRPKQSLEEIRRSMPFLVPSSSRRQNNVIVRPHSPAPVLLVQLDDLTPANLARVHSVAFLTLETSPGNFQAWVAVDGSPDADFARRLRKGAGADPTASGATRVAGTQNYKRKYEPGFPTVQVSTAQNGLTVAADRLLALGLVSPPERITTAPTGPELPATRRARGRWPDYDFCVQRAPMAHGGDKPDISRADFTWCMTALDWGQSADEVAARLMELSDKAKENGQDYALKTVSNAAAAVQRRRGRELAP
jgi:RepB DNA-primase from phage plasmid